jgi:uncharacterized protein (DUF736 family)
MQYDDSNKGVLFREKDKKSDSHPDFKGSINVEGNDYWLSGWVNESKAGQKYFKLSVSHKNGAAQPKPTAQATEFISEDIPF